MRLIVTPQRQHVGWGRAALGLERDIPSQVAVDPFLDLARKLRHRDDEVLLLIHEPRRREQEQAASGAGTRGAWPGAEASQPGRHRGGGP